MPRTVSSATRQRPLAPLRQCRHDGRASADTGRAPLEIERGLQAHRTSPRRLDLSEKIDGSARYGIDVTLPNMLYGAVKTCPTLSGTLKSFDDSAAKVAPGFHATVPLRDGVIVIADSYWRAQQALGRVRVEYEPGRLAGVDSARISQILRAALAEPGALVRNEGDAPAAVAGSPATLEAVYEVPYLAHACMEPMNCTARIDADGCEVWCGTQAPQAAQAAAAGVLGIPADWSGCTPCIWAAASAAAARRTSSRRP